MDLIDLGSAAEKSEEGEDEESDGEKKKKRKIECMELLEKEEHITWFGNLAYFQERSLNFLFLLEIQGK